jgi:agmatine deiminase
MDLKPMEHRTVRIGLVQNAVSPDADENLKRTLGLARKAARQGAGIICLQELFRTPYFPQEEAADASLYAETIPGESTAGFSALSREFGISIIVPIYEKGGDGRMYNTAAVVENGRILPFPYRKVHIPHDPLFFEKSYFAPGGDYRVFSCASTRIGVLICYDQWFPEPARAVTLMGAEIIFYPTAIGWVRGVREAPEGDWREAWETVQRGHAIANGVHVAAANRVGIEQELEFWGSSFVADAFGKIVARAGEERDELLMADLSLDMNDQVREGWGFLRNRRPDTYGVLAREEER